MDITAFIRELLFSHDCVIIPGFGGFIGNYTPAGIDRNSGVFYPPLKQISFNKNLNHNDGLLIGRVSEHSKLNYRDARNLVESFAGDVKRRLDRGEKVVFDNIGSFMNNQEGSILFEPDGSTNYLLDSYGFESFQYPQIERFDVRKKIMKYPQKEPSGHVSMRKILWRAAIVVPILAIMIAVPLKTDLFKSRIQTTTLNPLVKAEFEHNKSQLENDRTALEMRNISPATPGESGSVAATAGPAVPEAKAWVPPSQQTGYFVITGSFKSETNALLQAAELREEGFLPEVSEASNGFYRVSAMFCTDFETAIRKKDSIAANYPGSWVARKK